MIHDAALPPGFPSVATAVEERHGFHYTAARWTPDRLAELARSLGERGGPALRALPDERLLAAWTATVESFLDRRSSERRALDAALARFCGLSPAGLEAGLEAVLGGVLRGADRLLADARPTDDRLPVLIVLAGNLPALAVQPLLAALAVRRPALLKSPSPEPLFAPAFVTALTRRAPSLADAIAAVTWPGGDRALERPVLDAVGPILAYGEASSLADLGRRAPGRVVDYGPKTSLAAIGADVEPEAVALGLARDVALFDQRGCLSIQAVYAAGDARRLAEALAGALAETARRWPAGPADPTVAAAVHQMRAEADLRGLHRPDLPLAAGTVIVEPLPAFHPSPGLRTVRVHPLDDLSSLPGLLAAWEGRLQGAALAGDGAEALAPALEALGVSRCAPPGELQSPDALWHNGGVHPLAALA